jgi:WD40 repeat protein
MRRDRAAAHVWPRAALPRTGLTPKQEFNAVTGPERRWWRHCQDVVRALSGESRPGESRPGESRPGESVETRLNALFAAEERLAELGDEQASSADSARTFVSAVRMMTDMTWLAAQGTEDDTRDDRLETRTRTARFWDDSGLLAPVAGGGHPDAAQAMVLLTERRLAGVQPRSRPATGIPVLFDKTGAGVSGALQIHDLPGGPPGLYPDPEAMSFVRADQGFTSSLANAWFYATRGRVVDTCVIWRLDLNDGTAIPFLRGESLGAAFAIALRDHFRKHLSLTRPWEPVGTFFFGLRPQCAVTGAIDVDESLAAVGGLEAKLKAARDSRWRLVAPTRNRDASVHAPAGLQVYWASTLRQASRYARRWHPVKTSIAGLAVALAVALSTLTLIDHQLMTADDDAAATQLLGVSPSLSTSDPVTSRLDAITAWRLDPSAQARMTMLNSATLPQIAAFSGAPFATGTVAFSPDGSLLAVASAGAGGGPSGVRLWDVRTRQQAGLLQASASSGFGNGFSPMAFSPTGKILALGVNDGTVLVWDVASRRLIGTDTVAPGDTAQDASGLAFSPDGKTMAVATTGGDLEFWNVSDGRQQGPAIHLTDGSAPSGAGALAFSPDGKTLATVVPNLDATGAHPPGELVKWNVASHRQVGSASPLPAAGGLGPQGAAFSPNGKTLATIGGTPQIWNVASGSHITLPAIPGDPYGADLLSLDSDGETLAVHHNGSGTTEIWDTVTRQLITVLPGGGSPVGTLALSPDGRTLATVTSDGTTHLWNVGAVSPFTTSTVVNSLAISPGGQVLAATVPGRRGTIRLWNTVTGHPIGTLTSAETSGIGSAAFSPNGKVLAVGYDDGTGQLWDVASRHPMGESLPSADGAPSPGEGPNPPDFTFNPDGKTVLQRYDDGTMQVWEISAQAANGDFSPDDGVTAAVFTTDGKTLVTSGNAGVHLWNATGFQPEGLALGSLYPPTSLALSPNGRILAAGYQDGVVRFWDMATRLQIGPAVAVAASSDQVGAMAFSPDGETLATGSDDGAVQLVDVGPGQLIGGRLAEPGFTGAVQLLSFSSGGRALIAGTRDGTRVLNVDYLQDPATYLCELTGRPFTSAEWAHNVPQVGYQNVCG